jgi:antitoxin component YwqK of YwqJK toxin-antitoxin module
MRHIIFIALFFFILHHTYGQERRVISDTLNADSLIQVFYNNGKLFYQVPYKNGKQDGWYEQYHDNGANWIKYFIIDGKAVDGYYIALHENGAIYQKGFYKNGHQVGKWYCFTENGEPFKIYIYNKKGDWVKLKVWNPDKEKWEMSGLY